MPAMSIFGGIAGRLGAIASANDPLCNWSKPSFDRPIEALPLLFAPRACFHVAQKVDMVAHRRHPEISDKAGVGQLCVPAVDMA